LISWSLGLPFGDWSTDTSASLPPLTFTWTWTGPHWVWTTGPVTVREAVPAVVEPEAAAGGGEEAMVFPCPASGRDQRRAVAEQQHHDGDRAQQPVDNAFHRQVTT
jgi:hypothetical protein